MSSDQQNPDDISPVEQFNSLSHAIETFISRVKSDEEMPTRRPVNNDAVPQIVDIGIGTGANIVIFGYLLSAAILDSLSIDTTPPYTSNLIPDSSRHGKREVTFLDSHSKEWIRNTLKSAIPEGFSDLDQFIEAFVDERTQGTTATGGAARDMTKFGAMMGRNHRDLKRVFSLLNQDQPLEARIAVLLGGGTSTGGYHCLSGAMRNQVIPQSRMNGHYHRLFVQLEGPTDNTTVTTIGGQSMTTNEQQAETYRQIQEDIDAGRIATATVVSKDHTVISRAAEAEEKGTDYINDTIGSIHDPVEWDAVDHTVRNEAPVGGRRANYVMNDAHREILHLDDLMLRRPDSVEIITDEGDLDISDWKTAHLRGNQFVPAIVSATDKNDLAGLHDAEQRPQSLESCIRTAVRLSPWRARGPIETDSLGKVIICVAVSGDQTLTEADLQPQVAAPISDELNGQPDEVVPVAINNVDPDALPNGPNWLTVFALFGVENMAEVTNRLA